MNTIQSSLARVLATAAALAAATCVSAAPAQGLGPTAVYNEAVKVIDGVRHVQLPPLSNDDRVAFSAGLPPDKKPAESPQQAWLKGIKWDTPERENQMGWVMVEAEQGLVECTDSVYHPKQCRPSTYGQKKLSRTWLVLLGDQWRLCVDPLKVSADLPPAADPAQRRRLARLARGSCQDLVQPREGASPFRPRSAGLHPHDPTAKQ